MESFSWQSLKAGGWARRLDLTFGPVEAGDCCTQLLPETWDAPSQNHGQEVAGNWTLAWRAQRDDDSH